MTCPKCDNRSTEVYDSRKIKKYHGSVIRRRLCPKCHHSWTTYEIQQKYIDSVFGKDQDLIEALNELHEHTKKTSQILTRNFGNYLSDVFDRGRNSL